jgi:hypothetical protein
MVHLDFRLSGEHLLHRLAHERNVIDDEHAMTDYGPGGRRGVGHAMGDADEAANQSSADRACDAREYSMVPCE